jgi:leucyl aminopeptidase
MNVQTAVAPSLKHATPLLVLPLLEEAEEPSGLLAEVDELLGGMIARSRANGDFSGKKEKTLLLYTAEGSEAQRILLVGLGKADELDSETVRRVAGRGVRVAEGLKISALSFWLDPSWATDMEVMAQAAVEGAVLSAWRFRELKTQDEDGEETVDVSDFTLLLEKETPNAEAGARVGLALARGENFARTLQDRPGNIATPSHLADEAKAMAKAQGLKYSVLGPKEMRAEKMGALLAVAQGSDEEPRLIVLEHQGGAKGDPPLVLVGKGLTFDSGGISIKPSLRMEDMKYDMSGGAAVIGALKAVSELDIPLNVVGIVPSSENLLNGKAVKPGDVVRTREGKTVEVLNTDAEGRLILSDALSYGQDFKPAAMVDCATLTGACVIALGHVASAVLGTDEDLVEELRGAGERSGERCWPLPLWKEYRTQLDSTVADLQNIGGRPAGTITAATFLKEFVGDVPWAHLDIAGTAWGEGKLSYQRKGGTGVPTRLLVEWVRGRAG